MKVRRSVDYAGGVFRGGVEFGVEGRTTEARAWVEGPGGCRLRATGESTRHPNDPKDAGLGREKATERALLNLGQILSPRLTYIEQGSGYARLFTAIEERVKRLSFPVLRYRHLNTAYEVFGSRKAMTAAAAVLIKAERGFGFGGPVWDGDRSSLLMDARGLSLLCESFRLMDENGLEIGDQPAR